MRKRCPENGVSVIGMHSTVDGIKGDHINFSPAYILDLTNAKNISSIISKSIFEMAKELA